MPGGALTSCPPSRGSRPTRRLPCAKALEDEIQAMMNGKKKADQAVKDAQRKADELMRPYVEQTSLEAAVAIGKERAMMIAQITDMHVRPRAGRLRPGRHQRYARGPWRLPEALPRKPDLVIATGDPPIAGAHRGVRGARHPRRCRCRFISCPATTIAGRAGGRVRIGRLLPGRRRLRTMWSTAIPFA